MRLENFLWVMILLVGCSTPPKKDNLILYQEVKKYPVILTLDPNTKEVPPEKEILFATIHESLANTFTIVDASDLSLAEVYKTLGDSSMENPEDYLFKKYNTGDVCVYISGNIQEVLDPITQMYFYRPKINCRVLDLVTKRELIKMSKAPKNPLRPVGLTRQENQYAAMKTMATALAKELAQKLDNSITAIVKKSYFIKGILNSTKDLAKLRSVLQDLQNEKEFTLKTVNIESSVFEYEVVSNKLSAHEVARLIREASLGERLRINVRVSRRQLLISKHSG